MIFSLLVVLIQSQIKICVCHKRCSSLCHNDFINTYYNPTFKDFLLHYLDKNNELELNFYSEEDNFSFEINLSNFVNNKIILKNFIDSKPVNVIIMNGNSLVEKILINPNNQISFPKLKSNILSQTQNNAIYNDALVPKDTSESNTREYDDIEGLINITCDKFNNYKSVSKCVDGPYALGGSYLNSGGIINYTFNGTKIYVVAHENEVSAVVDISIDGKFVCNASHGKNFNSYPIVLSSDIYPFGEHTITIEHKGTSKAFFVNSLLVDPLPKVGGHKLGFSDIQNNTGWELNNTLKTPFFRSATNGTSFIFKFHGTRFWLTGIRDDSYGECNLIIDDGEPIKIDGRIGIDNFVESAVAEGKTVPVRVRANGNQGVLFYESDVLDFKDHTIKIVKLDSREFRIINLLYTTQPYNAIVVPSNEITFDGNWIEETGGYSANFDGSRGKITEYLNHFWIIGNKTTNDQALMNIYYNEEKVININVSKIDTIFSNEILFRSSNTIPRDTYSIEIEKTSYPPGSTTNFLHISYLYYLNEKTINVDDDSHKISINEMENNKNGTWNHDDDNIFTEEKDASISVEFFGNKFWIYGTVDPNYGIIDIIFDGEKQSHVSLYNEKHIKNIVLYESPEANSQDVHSLKLINQKKSRISIYQIVYQVLPSTELFSLSNDFTESKDFSNTDMFTRTGAFSRTTDFTRTDEFSGTLHFTETNEFSKTDSFTRTNDFTRSDKFSRSSFFSGTGHFTGTAYFSSSVYFSETAKFSKSLDFSGTQGFSQSIAFSPSFPIVSGDHCLYESQEKNYTTGDCNFTIKNQNDVIIRIILTNFTDYIEMYDGGAVYINNAGLDCTSISFTHCISTKGGGGAIYIKNTPDLLHNVTIDDTLIKRCQAQYGGGCYIYSQSEENEVFITRSNFSENVAILKKQTDESKNFFGGSHLFITAKNVIVKFSIFEKGVASGVKVYNVFDQIVGGAKKLDEAPNHIFISGCNFDHEGDSSSINFIDAKSDSKIELVECSFAGKIAENSHYIDGKVASKDADNIKLISCNFEYKNKMAVRIDTLSEDDLLEIKENQKNASLSSLSGLNSLGILVIILSIALIIITLISLVILLLSKRQFELDDKQNSN